jgi:DNA-binding transcriptional MocR family regulator
MNHEILKAEYNRVWLQYENHKSGKHIINMARGKPGVRQVAMSHGMLTVLRPDDCVTEDGTDALNYGGNEGLYEMKRLFAQILDAAPEDVLVGGNSSLNLMYDCAATFFMKKWGKAKFLCPVPGYDRHFAICEYLGIEMIAIPMTPGGPDMDIVEPLAAQDESIAGMWCVPVFSNPQGYTYSNDVVRRLASMPVKNPDFKLLWDNAYTVHHFRGERPQIPDIMRECANAGHGDRPIMFASFSKISIPGMGVAALISSKENLSFLHKRIEAQTVGPDKVNQLRHVRFFKNLDGVLSHMRLHAALLKPKFDLAERILNEQLSGTGAANWFMPDGGYFFALDTMPGCAKRVGTLCREAGVTLTEAGATFPYGKDPNDQNLRIALSYLTLDETEKAIHILCTAVKLAALEKLKGI